MFDTINLNTTILSKVWIWKVWKVWKVWISGCPALPAFQTLPVLLMLSNRCQAFTLRPGQR